MRTESAISPDLSGRTDLRSVGEDRQHRATEVAQSGAVGGLTVGADSVAAVCRQQEVGLQGQLCGQNPRHEAHAWPRAKGLQVPFLFFALANFFTQEIDEGEITHGFGPRIK
jgi:hypothetical protein